MCAKQNKVWIIEDGDYSDYHIIGIFSSKENANMIREKTGGEVREWFLDPCVKEINKDYRQYHIYMLKNGDVETIKSMDFNSYWLEGKTYVWERSKAPAYQGKNIEDVLDSIVWAKNEKHAIKIVNEKRGQMIANGEWK